MVLPTGQYYSIKFYANNTQPYDGLDFNMKVTVRPQTVKDTTCYSVILSKASLFKPPILGLNLSQSSQTIVHLVFKDQNRKKEYEYWNYWYSQQPNSNIRVFDVGEISLSQPHSLITIVVRHLVNSPIPTPRESHNVLH